ncbi:hypothetical protein NL108_003808 [Boleophthalmus pectinirostris]|uniref:uncharacterized protein zgc:194655 n=1 Tax=Boleophthalmus pectinirostris TaxID=150288 RepID=UPI00242DED6C|nr:uncharacterized protein zgc:194655 [Boleophthalmus pectinirostris]KAJ0055448.1 hypothetical protein NL108_003808 [Boleophthalmus pectinirostris]
MGRLYQVVVTGFKGERMTVDLCNTDEQMRSMTVEQLKNKISAKLPSNTEPDRISLIFADERLDVETKLLTDYGIQHMSVIQLVLQVDGGLAL